MQILPQQLATSDSATSGTTRQSSLTTKQTAVFASLLSDMAATSSSTAGLGVASSASASTIGDPLTAAKLPSQAEVMSLPLTREDIAALNGDLQAVGFSESEISDLQARTDSAQGMTWGDLMGEVKKKVTTSDSTKKAETTTSEQTQMLAFFQNMGFTADESQQLLDSLAKGETSAVWNKVKAKLSALGEDATVNFDSDEVAAVAKGFNLSDTAQERLRTLFGQTGTLNKQGVDTAVSVIQGEIDSKLAKESQSLEQFKQAAASVLNQAWQKNGKKRSDLHEDDVARKAAQAVSLGGSGKTGDASDATAKPIIHSAADVTADLPKVARENKSADQDNGQRVAQAKTVAAQTSLQTEISQVATESKTADAQDQTAGVQDKTAAAKTAGKTAQVNGHALEAQLLQGTGGSATGGQSDQSGLGTRDGEDGWGQFWSKVRSAGIVAGTSTSDGTGQSSLAGTAVAAMDGTVSRLDATVARPVDSGLAQRAARQLETGLLRDMGQGTKQLTLTLNPDELGKLSVTLTVRDKEVRATITADNSDTAAMLQEQAAKIKQNLEDQGFKVTKLDVQTGLAQDNQSWQSPEQHNMAREQRQAMDRARTSLLLSQMADDRTVEAESIAVIPGTMSGQGAGLDLFT